MKLASLNKGRDGELMIVSRDLSQAIKAPIPTLQTLLDDWNNYAPILEDLYKGLNQGEEAGAFPFDPAQCAAPLPRAYQWIDGSAYVNHVELVRRARGAELPDSFWHEPLVYQGGSDHLLGATENIPYTDNSWGLDFESEVAIITDDTPFDTNTQHAEQHIKLLMLVNDISLRGLIPGELSKGFGFYQSKPATAFSPVAITPDELTNHWHGGKLHLPLQSHLNNNLFGKPNAGKDMTFSFHDLIAHLTKTRKLTAGTIIGSGTVSNKQGTDHGSAIAHGGLGYSCLAELRMIETIRDGSPITPFLKPGDQIKIEMLDAHEQSLFGAINQTVIASQ